MKTLSEELEVNFASFNGNLKTKLSDSFTALEENKNCTPKVTKEFRRWNHGGLMY